MDSDIHLVLAPWANFYLITGTAAAALTGLQFVVQTLLASDALRPAIGADPEGGIAAFGTPTVVHFSMALVLSALMCGPWSNPMMLRVTLGIIGAGALVYSVIVMRRAHRQQTYATTAYDWTWYMLLPGGAYAAVLIAAVLLDRREPEPLAAVGIATLMLICVGIHNAWDTVTYLTVNAFRNKSEGAPAPPPRRKQGTKTRGHRR